jgi:hypothetical protein
LVIFCADWNQGLNSKVKSRHFEQETGSNSQPGCRHELLVLFWQKAAGKTRGTKHYEFEAVRDEPREPEFQMLKS